LLKCFNFILATKQLFQLRNYQQLTDEEFFLYNPISWAHTRSHSAFKIKLFYLWSGWLFNDKPQTTNSWTLPSFSYLCLPVKLACYV